MTDLDALLDRLHDDMTDEEVARILLELTLQAAPPVVADAIRVCALPAYFDAEILALLTTTSPHLDPLPNGERERTPLPDRERGRGEGAPLSLVGRGTGGGGAPRTDSVAALLERIAAFSFVLPREGGGYVYHESTRARLLDWWRLPQNRARYAALTDRLAQYYITLAREYVPHLQGPHYLAALTALDAAYPNLRAAWEGAAETENWPRVRDLAYDLADYFMLRGRWTDWIAWTRASLDARARLGDKAGAVALQNNLGATYYKSGGE